MNLPDIRGMINVGKSLIMANRPEILLGSAIVATGASVILAARGGYKSGHDVAMLTVERAANDEPNPVPTRAEIVQLTWRNYVPAALATTTALGATTGLHFIHVHEKKLLVASGLAAVEEARKAAQEYIEDMQNSVDNNTGEKTNAKIKAEMLERNAARHGGMAHLMDSSGMLTQVYPVRDARSLGTKWSNQLEVEEALLLVNEEIIQDGEASLDTFYSHWGLESPSEAQEYGWSGAERPEAKWSTSRRDDGQPIAVFTLVPPPHRGYDKSR